MNEWVERLGLTLLHFVWQGAIVAAIYGIARKGAAACRPNVRYLVACAALALMALAPLGTWLVLRPSQPGANVISDAPRHCCIAPGTHPDGLSTVRAEVSGTLPTPFPASFLAWVVAGWFVGAVGFGIRLAGGWAVARRLRRRSVQSAEPEWQRTFAALKDRIRVSRPVRLLVSALVEAPTVVGWLRPVVLIPAGALARLPGELVQALLLHELAHIYRHDYLVNIVQGVLETLLFYHPAVWWVSRHIRTERELCCDDLALSVSGDALTYARALTEVAAAARGQFGPAVAANGGSMAHRIARILGESRSTPRCVTGPEVFAAAILLGLTGFALFGQPAVRPQFEAASVKPSAGSRLRVVRPGPGGLTASAPLLELMQDAYGVQTFQIVGAPNWADSDTFRIEASAGHKASRAEVFQMLRTLLEERFRLQMHHESRDLPIYSLIAAKSGLKLSPPKEGACEEPPADAPMEWAGGRMQPPGEVLPSLPKCGTVRVQLEPSGIAIEGGKASMPELVRTLSLVMGRTVVDQTGFSGMFDLTLRFLADESTPAVPGPPPGSEAPADGRYAPIAMALREQLGMNIQSGRGPVDVIVIDRVERPAGN